MKFPDEHVSEPLCVKEPTHTLPPAVSTVKHAVVDNIAGRASAFHESLLE